jgi:hypothetical protein
MLICIPAHERDDGGDRHLPIPGPRVPEQTQQIAYWPSHAREIYSRQAVRK